MTSLKEIIIEKFITSLREANELDESAIDALRQLLTDNAKVKVDELVSIFEHRDEVA